MRFVLAPARLIRQQTKMEHDEVSTRWALVVNSLFECLKQKLWCIFRRDLVPGVQNLALLVD